MAGVRWKEKKKAGRKEGKEKAKQEILRKKAEEEKARIEAAVKARASPVFP